MEDISGKNPKYGRTTAEQLKCYVKYCKEYPELPYYQTQKNTKIAPTYIHDLWEKLVNDLNALRGPTKDIKSWKITLSHWRKQVRCRTRKLKAQGHSDSELSPYADLVLYDDEKPKIVSVTAESYEEPIEKCEEMENSNEIVISHQPESDVEFPFDSVFYPCDDGEKSSTTQSKSTTPARQNDRTSAKEQNENLVEICHKLVKCLEAREARDERLFTQQQSVIAKLDQTLLLMTQVLVKLNDKFDKL